MCKRDWIALAITLMIALLLPACSESTPTIPTGGMERPNPPAEYADKKNPRAGDATAAESGKSLYIAYCASCHGETGMGDGPASASLNPHPTALAKVQSSLSDAYLYWRVAEGGRMEPFNSTMPGWKDIFSEGQIWEMVSYLRILGQ